MKLSKIQKKFFFEILFFLRNEALKTILIKINQKRKTILLKSFIKIYYANISQEKIKPVKTEEDIKSKLLKKIFNNLDTNRKCILKAFSEKWNLTSKIFQYDNFFRDIALNRVLRYFAPILCQIFKIGVRHEIWLT